MGVHRVLLCRVFMGLFIGCRGRGACREHGLSTVSGSGFNGGGVLGRGIRNYFLRDVSLILVLDENN